MCKCGYELFNGICIRNGCSKSENSGRGFALGSPIASRIGEAASRISDENGDHINDLFKDILRDKTHKFDKDEDYIYARGNFTGPRSGLADNIGKNVRQEPRRAGNKCKFIIHI